MTSYPHQSPAARQLRAKAVYGTLRQRRPAAPMIAAQCAIVGAIVLALAGFIGLRAWFAI